MTYISLLIIPCIIYHVTNKETLNLEPLFTVNQVCQTMRKNQIVYHSYADDTQIYLALYPNNYSPIDSLCQCKVSWTGPAETKVSWAGPAKTKDGTNSWGHSGSADSRRGAVDGPGRAWARPIIKKNWALYFFILGYKKKKKKKNTTLYC